MKGTTANKQEHPMIPVPHALRIVLTETAILKSAETTSGSASEEEETQESSEWMETTNNCTNDLCGRISYETVAATNDYPSYNASIMDGYAINTDQVKHILASAQATDLSEIDNRETDVTDLKNSTLAFDVIHKRYAGKANSIPQELMGLTAVYVTTGAVVPSSYNAVVPIEQVQHEKRYEKEALYSNSSVDDLYDKIHIRINLLETINNNHWIRPIGCDIPSGTVILSPGQVIEPAHVGLLIQSGIDRIKVTRLPTVGILSTGNELVQFDNNSASLLSSGTFDIQGIIPDANGPVLASLISSFRNCRPKYLGILKDDEEEHVLQETLRNAVDNHDVVITTGGISMGEMDVIEKALLQIGCKLQFGRLHMKPGKPCTFFTYTSTTGRRKLVFALPGNPVSAIVCSELFLRPCLNMLHQWNASMITTNHDQISDIAKTTLVLHPEVFATLQTTVKLDTSRPEYHRVSIYHSSNDGGSTQWSAVSSGNQRSSRLCSMNSCDGLMLLPQGIENGKVLANTGEKYPVLILNMPVNGLFKYINSNDSVHIKSRSVTVGIIQIRDRDTNLEDDTTERVYKSIKDCLGGDPYLLLNICTIDDTCQLEKSIRRMISYIDVVLIVMDSAFTLTQNLELNAKVNLMLSKPLPHVAHLAKKGAYACKQTSALFENVAGMYSIGHYCTLLVTLSNDSLDGSIPSIQPLLYSIVNVV
jgi:molybdenum cofactor synthesis domain-containing protein